MCVKENFRRYIANMILGKDIVTGDPFNEKDKVYSEPTRNCFLFALSRVWHIKLSDVSLGTRPRYSLVVDEDVKKPNKETIASAY